ncbi:hypothetical protein ColKHC_13611 [Colletotrichum higginsianum]|nr:hypothetical protein ColKHC_13611 [Colletotrichum higginsianum]
MPELVIGELGRHVEALQVLCQQLAGGVNVLLLELAQALGRRGVRQLVLADLVLRLAVGRQRAEADLVQLLPVEGAVEVAARADGLGQHYAARVEALPDAAQVAAARDLLDEHGREALAAQLLVDDHKVDLGAGDDVLAHAQVDGDSRDECDELPGLRRAHTDVPLLAPAGSHECPARHVLGVLAGRREAGHDVLQVELLHGRGRLLDRFVARAADAEFVRKGRVQGEQLGELLGRQATDGFLDLLLGIAGLAGEGFLDLLSLGLLLLLLCAGGGRAGCRLLGHILLSILLVGLDLGLLALALVSGFGEGVVGLLDGRVEGLGLFGRHVLFSYSRSFRTGGVVYQNRC